MRSIRRAETAVIQDCVLVLTTAHTSMRVMMWSKANKAWDKVKHLQSPRKITSAQKYVSTIDRHK